MPDMTVSSGASARSIARERQPLPRPGTGAASPAGRNRADAMTEVALTLFAERNFASVTIKDIGTALGVIDLHDPIQKLVKVSLDYAGLPIELPEVERSIRQFYDEEYHTLTRCIQEGIDLGIFRPVDAGRTAEWVSTWLDGLMVRSKIFPDLDVAAAIDSLREMLWAHLGYQQTGGQQPAAT